MAPVAALAGAGPRGFGSVDDGLRRCLGQLIVTAGGRSARRAAGQQQDREHGGGCRQGLQGVLELAVHGDSSCAGYVVLYVTITPRHAPSSAD